jgi:hypothetical protein
MLNQPSGGGFDPACGCGIARDTGAGDRLQIREFLFGNDGILEKRSGAAAIRITLDGSIAAARIRQTASRTSLSVGGELLHSNSRCKSAYRLTARRCRQRISA